MDPNQLPVLFFAFANDKREKGAYLNLTYERNRIDEKLRSVDGVLCRILPHPDATIDTIIDVFTDQRYRGKIVLFHYGGHADQCRLILEEVYRLVHELNNFQLQITLGLMKPAREAYLADELRGQVLTFCRQLNEEITQKTFNSSLPVIPKQENLEQTLQQLFYENELSKATNL